MSDPNRRDFPGASVPIQTTPGGAVLIPNPVPGSVLFTAADGSIGQDSTNLFWDSTTKQLKATSIRIPTLTPGSVLFAGTDGVFSEDAGRLTYDTATRRLVLLKEDYGTELEFGQPGTVVDHAEYPMILQSTDAGIALISRIEGGHGSFIDFISVDASGVLVDKFVWVKESTGSGSADAELALYYSTDNRYSDATNKRVLTINGAFYKMGLGKGFAEVDFAGLADFTVRNPDANGSIGIWRNLDDNDGSVQGAFQFWGSSAGFSNSNPTAELRGYRTAAGASGRIALRVRGASSITRTMIQAESDGNVSLCLFDGTPDYGGGSRVVYLKGASTEPTTNPVGGALLWSSGGEIKARSSSGEVVNLFAIATANLADDAVTYAKIQNVSAASKLLGRGSAGGAGDPEEITLGSGLTMTGTTLSASGGGTDADAIHDNVAGEIAAITAKSLPIAADFAVIEDSAASNAKKSATVGAIRRPDVNIYAAAQTLDADDFIVQADPSGGAFSLTLPLAANSRGLYYWVKNVHNSDTPALGLEVSGTDDLEFGGSNFSNISIGGMDSGLFYSDGTQWWTLVFHNV